ncbi:MAG: glycosyl hydrolase family 28 protein [Nibricoccus sp.]
MAFFPRALFLLTVFVLSELLCLRSFASEPRQPEIKGNVRVVTEKEFGAVADGVTDNAKAIQSAIRAASKAGGGTVQIPAAEKAYASGPLKLESGVELRIDPGATLAMLPYKVYPGTEDFITLDNLHDVRVSGGGVIDGQGAPWWKAFDDEKVKRPKTMLAVVKSDRVRVEGVTFLNPPNTHMQLRNASNVTIAGLTISSPEKSHNTDGIDVSGRSILIDRCKIACGDDNIAIGGSSVANEDITITNCEFGHGHGLSIGSYTSGGLRNLRVENCSFAKTMSGIRMKTARDRGGVVENLSYSNITMTDVEKPIFITGYYPDKTIPKDPASDAGAPVTPKTPVWRNIVIKNLTSRAAMDNKRCTLGIIWSVPEMPAGEIVLDNVSISAPGELVVCNALMRFRGDVRFEGRGSAVPPKVFNSLILASQPRDQHVAEGGEAFFEVTVQGGKAAGEMQPAVQWSRAGVLLADGRQADGVEISGAKTPRLVLKHATAAVAGKYTAAVSSELTGSPAPAVLNSDPAELTVKRE